MSFLGTVLVLHGAVCIFQGISLISGFLISIRNSILTLSRKEYGSTCEKQREQSPGPNHNAVERIGGRTMGQGYEWGIVFE